MVECQARVWKEGTYEEQRARNVGTQQWPKWKGEQHCVIGLNDFEPTFHVYWGRVCGTPRARATPLAEQHPVLFLSFFFWPRPR